MKLSVWIIGTTGVGKTKLSLQLGKILHGQIISCDSKQLYQYANIMTAKVNKKQQQLIQHHMINCLKLHQQTYNRNKYYKQTQEIIKQIRKSNHIPIIVGGTNYYLEPLLYRLNSMNETNQEQQGKQQQKQYEKQQQLQQMMKLGKNQKYKMLQQFDPIMAGKLHMNDEVRVTSFLKQWIISGQKPSDKYKPYTHQLRNKQTILFWVMNSDKKQHLEFITKRIKQMVSKDGIIQILSIFTYFRNFNGQNQSGILQSIGYKEFHQLYIDFMKKLQIQSSQKYQQLCMLKQYLEIFSLITYLYDKYNSVLINKDILRENESQLIRNTKNYCKRQLTWIRNRLFVEDGHHQQNFFVLDLGKKGDKDQQLTLEQRYNKYVRNRAIDIINTIRIKGIGAIRESDTYFRHRKFHLIENKRYECKICNINNNILQEWQQHLKSKKHKKNMKKLDKDELYKKKQTIKQTELNMNEKNIKVKSNNSEQS